MIDRTPSVPTRLADLAFRRAAAGAAALALGGCLAAAGYLATQASPAVRAHGVAPLAGSGWNPEANDLGLWPAIFGTLYSSLGAIAIATVFGVAAAIVVTQDFLPRRLAAALGGAVDLLAGVPSVIYGFWGLVVFAPALKPVANGLGASLGFTPFFAGTYENLGMLPATLVLAVMVLPTVSAVSREALLAVPASLRDGAVALGATKWEAIRNVMLPAARGGIVGGVTLGLGRALGETMALAMLVGNKHVASLSLLSPGTTLAALLALKFPEAGAGAETAMLMYAAVVLLAVTLLVNVIGVGLVGATRTGGRP